MKVKISNTGALVDESAAPAIYDEMRKASITPSSFDYREFVDDITEPTYVENYFSGRVIRFGINAAMLKPEPGVYDPSSVAGAGRSTASNSSKFSEIARKVVHHSAEKHVFNAAIGYIFTSGANAVICDILVRDKGSITSWPPEVHSVILYNNPIEPVSGKHKITIVDPSNLQYSSHLSNDDMKASCSHPMLESIVTFFAPLQIYKPYGPTGYDRAMCRDCVDIAVKLSLGFNSSALSPMTSMEHVKAHPVIVAISNMENIDSSFAGETLPVRIKQTSDHGAVMYFKRLEDYIFRALNLLRTIKEKAHERIDSYDEVLVAATGQVNYDAFVGVKSSKAGVIARLQSIIDQEESLETEYNALLSGASDPSCFTPLAEFEAKLTSIGATLFDQLD